MWREREIEWLTKIARVIKQLPREVLYDCLCNFAYSHKEKDVVYG